MREDIYSQFCILSMLVDANLVTLALSLALSPRRPRGSKKLVLSGYFA